MSWLPCRAFWFLFFVLLSFFNFFPSFCPINSSPPQLLFPLLVLVDPP